MCVHCLFSCVSCSYLGLFWRWMYRDGFQCVDLPLQMPENWFQFTKAASSTPQYLHLYYSNESWWLLRLQHFDLKRQFIILFLFHPRVIQTHMTDCGEIFREMSQCILSILCLLEEMQSQLCVIWVNDDRMLILGWTVTFWTTMNSFSVYAVEQMRLREGVCVRLLNSSVCVCVCGQVTSQQV